MMHLCITQCTYWTPLLVYKDAFLSKGEWHDGMDLSARNQLLQLTTGRWHQAHQGIFCEVDREEKISIWKSGCPIYQDRKVMTETDLDLINL